jgi:outer membrane protein assembly factor BamA
VTFGLHDNEVFVRKGARVVAGGSAYPALWSVDSPFGEAHVEGNVYVPLWRPVLALRAGGKRVWGDDFPLHDAAFVGGRTTLRGYQWDRFTGDTEAHGTAELRMPLGRVELFARGDLGVFAFTDVGRVWFNGNSPGGWHDSQGGGVWFATLGQAVSLMYGKGEEGRVYIQFGLPF